MSALAFTGLSFGFLISKLILLSFLINAPCQFLGLNGEIGVNAGPNGDLYIDISVKDHPLFERENENLICEVPISIPNAVVGGSVDIPTLEGKSELKIPAGVQPGQVMRLRGKGIKDLRSTRIGDLYVKLNIVIPKNISSKQKKLMQDFQKEIDKEATNPFSEYINKVKDFFN